MMFGIVCVVVCGFFFAAAKSAAAELNWIGEVVLGFAAWRWVVDGCMCVHKIYRIDLYFPSPPRSILTTRCASRRPVSWGIQCSGTDPFSLSDIF